eukprot:7177175-Prymnesium_polylepis.2
MGLSDNNVARYCVSVDDGQDDPADGERSHPANTRFLTGYAGPDRKTSTLRRPTRHHVTQQFDRLDKSLHTVFQAPTPLSRLTRVTQPLGPLPASPALASTAPACLMFPSQLQKLPDREPLCQQ